MGALMEWIKWYQEMGIRKNENDLRAVALQNQRAELDFNMERLRQQGAAQEQANQPLYTIPGEVSTERTEPGQEYSGVPGTTQTVGPEKKGPTPNQVEAVQKAGQYMTPEGLKSMGMAPKPATDKLRNVSPGETVIDESGKEVYKAPDRPQKQAIDWKQDATGGWVGLPATVDLPSLMTSGEIPPNAVVKDAGNGQVEVRVPPAQQDQQIKETNLSPIPMQGRRGQTQAPQPPGPAAQPQQPVNKPKPGVTPIYSGVIGKTTPTSPHNDLESYTETVLPGKKWADLNPKEQEKVLGAMAREANAKRTPGTESDTKREHLANAYKSAYNMEMNKILAVYRIMPPLGTSIDQQDVLEQMVSAARSKGKMSDDQFYEFSKRANELYSKFMVPWYKLYDIEAPKGMAFPEGPEKPKTSYEWTGGKLAPKIK